MKHKSKTEAPSKVNTEGLIEITKGSLLSDLLWVIKSRSNDDTRYILNRVSVDATHIACSDGRRLHAAAHDDHGIPVGTYEIVSVSQKSIVLRLNNDGTFPAWREVVPDTTKNYRMVGDVIDIHRGVFLANLSGSAVNVDYVRDAVRGAEMQCYVADKSSAVMFKSSRYTAVFMPIRFNGYEGPQ
jgi:hypothetical protein